MRNSLRSFFLLIASMLLIIAAKRDDGSIGVKTSEELFRTGSKNFALNTKLLRNAIQGLDPEKPETFRRATNALKQARLAYKQIEYFNEYFFFHSARIYNRAPKNEVEEPYPEYQEPMGLQYIEAMLSDEDPAKHQKDLNDQINILANSAGDLPSLLYKFKATDAQILESLRLDLIRIIALGITGFDAPVLKTGIEESLESMTVMQQALQPYLKRAGRSADSVNFYLNSCRLFLKNSPGFDSFNRLDFLTAHALPLQKHLGRMIRKMDLETNTYGFLNYRADHLFSPDALNEAAFGINGNISNKRQIALGKKLFSDPSLSGTNSMSCASCHQPANYFQDGLDKSLGFEQKKVQRNAPSLLYSGYQHSQFWDGRAKTLDNQIESVIKDPLEMHGSAAGIFEKVRNNPVYRKDFRPAFAARQSKEIDEQQVYRAIASYIRTLHPFNSDFDHYIAGNKQALSMEQISGFNLFMGKAQCGTCHFAPVFNGLTPPRYNLTEFEVLGTPLDDDLAHPKQDPDSGRIAVRAVKYYKGAFKTSGVRNAEVTGPYMHHGGFSSLDSLVEFYNKGGGAGLGFDDTYQTLSANPLNLTPQEKNDLIAFLGALTDR